MFDYLLYYDIEENYFIDEWYNAVYDLYTYITPNDFLIFTAKKKDMIVKNDKGHYIKLLYPVNPGGDPAIYNY